MEDELGQDLLLEIQEDCNPPTTEEGPRIYSDDAGFVSYRLSDMRLIPFGTLPTETKPRLDPLSVEGGRRRPRKPAGPCLGSKQTQSHSRRRSCGLTTLPSAHFSYKPRAPDERVKSGHFASVIEDLCADSAIATPASAAAEPVSADQWAFVTGQQGGMRQFTPSAGQRRPCRPAISKPVRPFCQLVQPAPELCDVVHRWERDAHIDLPGLPSLPAACVARAAGDGAELESACWAQRHPDDLLSLGFSSNQMECAGNFHDVQSGVEGVGQGQRSGRKARTVARTHRVGGNPRVAVPRKSLSGTGYEGWLPQLHDQLHVQKPCGLDDDPEIGPRAQHLRERFGEVDWEEVPQIGAPQSSSRFDVYRDPSNTRVRKPSVGRPPFKLRQRPFPRPAGKLEMVRKSYASGMARAPVSGGIWAPKVPWIE